MTATTICLINQKGGCGKSSICFHLAGAFAQTGLHVLLIDSDPQGSLSQGFFGSEFVEALPPELTVAALLAPEKAGFGERRVIQRTQFDGIAICPANSHSARLNTPAPETTGLAQFALREFVDDLTAFDVILVDCPPNLYRCTWSAMVACDWCLVPVPPEDFGTQGLRVVHQAIEQARRLNPGLQCLGHVVTRSDSRLLVHRAYEQRLRELYGQSVLETVIPEFSAFKVALACRQPVSIHAPRSAAAVLTKQLSREILDHIAMSNKRTHVA
ncbi:MAG: ParA family protein [Planctomycetota bacterium]|nr:MAG: ParA family protein [Planctomycetota bacterium]REK28024.1 MAG: ParA family protein [Planctomycetota bacterium]REK37551.1 MAG: ParA family protein [Planctomycetota bacterium]